MSKQGRFELCVSVWFGLIGTVWFIFAIGDHLAGRCHGFEGTMLCDSLADRGWMMFILMVGFHILALLKAKKEEHGQEPKP